MTPVPGDLWPSPGLHRLQAYLLCTNDHVLSPGMHIVSYTHANGLDIALHVAMWWLSSPTHLHFTGH